MKKKLIGLILIILIIVIGAGVGVYYSGILNQTFIGSSENATVFYRFVNNSCKELNISMAIQNATNEYLTLDECKVSIIDNSTLPTENETNETNKTNETLEITTLSCWKAKPIVQQAFVGDKYACEKVVIDTNSSLNLTCSGSYYSNELFCLKNVELEKPTTDITSYLIYGIMGLIIIVLVVVIIVKVRK